MKQKSVHVVEECTPDMEGYETFMVCSSFDKACYVKQLYAKNYPQNGYRISQHILDDERLIKIEEV